MVSALPYRCHVVAGGRHLRRGLARDCRVGARPLRRARRHRPGLRAQRYRVERAPGCHQRALPRQERQPPLPSNSTSGAFSMCDGSRSTASCPSASRVGTHPGNPTRVPIPRCSERACSASPSEPTPKSRKRRSRRRSARSAAPLEEGVQSLDRLEARERPDGVSAAGNRLTELDTVGDHRDAIGRPSESMHELAFEGPGLRDDRVGSPREPCVDPAVGNRCTHAWVGRAGRPGKIGLGQSMHGVDANRAPVCSG